MIFLDNTVKQKKSKGAKSRYRSFVCVLLKCLPQKVCRYYLPEHVNVFITWSWNYHPEGSVIWQKGYRHRLSSLITCSLPFYVLSQCGQDDLYNGSVSGNKKVTTSSKSIIQDELADTRCWLGEPAKSTILTTRLFRVTVSLLAIEHTVSTNSGSGSSWKL